MSSQNQKIPATEFTTDGKYTVVQEHDSGWYTWRITKKVVASASADVTLGSVPANSFITSFALDAQAVGSAPITTGSHLGLGVSGSLAKFDEVIEASVDESDTYIDQGLPVTCVAQTTKADLLLSATNGSGAASGSFTGTWYAIVTGKTFKGFA